MIDKNIKIISDILLNGNYKNILNYNFINKKSVREIYNFYNKYDKYKIIKNRIKNILDGFINNSKLKFYLLILISIDLNNCEDDNKIEKSILSIKNIIKKYINYDYKERITNLLKRLCLGSFTLKKNLISQNNEDFLIILYHIVLLVNKNNN